MFHEADHHKLYEIPIQDIEINTAGEKNRTCLVKLLLLLPVVAIATISVFFIATNLADMRNMNLHEHPEIKQHNSHKSLMEALWKKKKPGDIENAHGAIAFAFTQSVLTSDSGYRMALENDITTALKDHNMTDTSWINEKLGIYLIALKSVCVDTRNFNGINLLKIVTDRMTSSREDLRNNRGWLSLWVLGLCVHEAEVPQFAIDDLSDDIGIYKHGPSPTFYLQTYNVVKSKLITTLPAKAFLNGQDKDEASLIAMALMCTEQSKVALQAALNFTKMELATTHNTATLAQEVQVLQANSIVFSLVDEKKKMLEKVVEYPHSADLDAYMTAQILPVLVGKTFVDIKYMECR